MSRFSHLTAAQAEAYAIVFRRRDLRLPVDLEVHLRSVGIDPDSITDRDTPPVQLPAIRKRSRNPVRWPNLPRHPPARHRPGDG